MNESIDNLVAYQPSPDALAEISVETNNYAADTGNVAGAVISNVIKSGSNQLQGQRLRVLPEQRDGRELLGQQPLGRGQAGTPAGHLRRHAGRAARRRTSCSSSANYQGTRFNAPGFETLSVAPDAWRDGDLSSVSVGRSAIRSPARRLPATRFPSGRISPIARAILNNTSLYPLPNRTVSGGVIGNFVGETLTTIRAHQGDVRIDWNASTEGQDLRTLLVRRVRVDETTSAAFPLLLGSLTDGAVSQPGAELEPRRQLVARQRAAGRLQPDHHRDSETLDWAGIGNANATFGIAGGQPIPGLSSIGGAAADGDRRRRERHRHARQDLSDQREAHLAEGRHTLKSGGQLLHYVQQRFYAGNNGRSACSATAACSPASRSPISCSTRWRAKAAAALRSPGRTCTTGSRSTSRTTSRSRPALTLNLGMRWAYTQPVVEKDNRQANFDLKTGRQIAAQDGSRESRALYKAYKKGLRAAARRSPGGRDDRWVVRGGYGISQYMEGTGANLRLPLNPPFFFESAVSYDATTGAGTLATGFADVEAARSAVGPGAGVGSEPASAVHAAVERLRRAPADPVDVRERRLRRPQREASGDAGRGQPAAARRRRSVDLGATGQTASAVRDGAADHQHLDDRRARPQRLQRAAGQRPAADVKGSSTSRRTR